MPRAEQFKIEWRDAGREPRSLPNPAYPNGIDVGAVRPLGAPACTISLPYPAKRVGAYVVECTLCGARVALTTAGRPDDPRSVTIACKMEGGRQ